MDIKEALEQIGLSTNEIKVYLFLVNHGSSKAGKIARITQIQRSSAYSAINSLTHKGLIGFVLVGKVKYFQATPPERLLEYIREQEEIVKDIMPDLKKKQKKEEGQISLYKGRRGVMTVFKDIIRTGIDNDVFGDDGQLSEKMPVFCKQFVREQNRIGMKTRLLCRLGRYTPYSKGSIFRFVDEDTESPVATNIYGNKIAIIVWTEEPEAIIIENEAAAKSYKSYFEFMWRRAKEKRYEESKNTLPQK